MNSDQREKLLLQSNYRTINQAYGIHKLSASRTMAVLMKAGKLPVTVQKRLIKVVKTV